MKSLQDIVNENAVTDNEHLDNRPIKDKTRLITKYLDAYTVEATSKPKTIVNPMPYTNYLVTCTRKEDIKTICTAIWKIISEWFGRKDVEEDAIKYTTNLWTGAWDTSELPEDKRFIKISFDLYDKPQSK